MGRIRKRAACDVFPVVDQRSGAALHGHALRFTSDTELIAKYPTRQSEVAGMAELQTTASKPVLQEENAITRRRSVIHAEVPEPQYERSAPAPAAALRWFGSCHPLPSGGRLGNPAMLLN